MRQTLVSTIALMILVLTGCHNQHVTNRQAARDRWTAARTEFSLKLAREQLEAGQLNKAAVTTQDIIKLNEKSVPAYLLLGRIYLEQDRPVQARQALLNCLELEPENAQAYYNLGIVHEKWQEFDKALAHYRQAWKYQPDSVPYFLAVVEVMISQGDLDTAGQLITQNIDNFPRDASIYVAAGAILIRQGKTDQAVEMFYHASLLNPNEASITESLAFALLEAGRASEALPLFEQLTKNDQQNQDVPRKAYLLALGDCYLQLNRLHEAQRTFERLSTCDAANPVAWTRLAQVALARNNLDQARLHANQALALTPDNNDASLVLGYIALKQQNHTAAQKILRRIITADPGNGLAYCLLGQSFDATGDQQQAAECYTHALTIDPKDNLAKRLMVAVKAKPEPADMLRRQTP